MTQYITHIAKYTVHSTMYTSHSIQNTVHSAHYKVHITHNKVHSTEHTLQRTNFTSDNIFSSKKFRQSRMNKLLEYLIENKKELTDLIIGTTRARFKMFGRTPLKIH